MMRLKSNYIFFNDSAAAREKLKEFQGASGFGSADYYGRDEEEMEFDTTRRGSRDVLVSAAHQFATTFVGQAQEDLDNIKKAVSYGSSKLGEILSEIQVF
jgi:ADP-ribosylation factor GTPase-activating protein 2/3